MGNADSKTSSANFDDQKVQTTETTTTTLEDEVVAPEQSLAEAPPATANTTDFKLDLTHDSSAARRGSSRRKSSTTPNVKNTEQRRVVKAKQPPPLASPSSSSELIAEDVVGEGGSAPAVTTTDEEERGTRAFVSKIAPSVEDETNREMSEKWRRERLGAVAASSKEKKEKELEQRRKASVADSGEAAAAVSAAPEEETASASVRKTPLPAILSVEPQFPEHKRSVETASLPPDDAPLEKKVKIDNAEAKKEEEAEDEKDNTRSLIIPESDEGGSSGISKWAKMVVPAVTVAAFVAIVAMKMTKKK